MSDTNAEDAPASPASKGPRQGVFRVRLVSALGYAVTGATKDLPRRRVTGALLVMALALVVVACGRGFATKPIPTATPRPSLTGNEAVGFIRDKASHAQGAQPAESIGRFLERDEARTHACSAREAELLSRGKELGSWKLEWSAKLVLNDKWVVWVACHNAVTQGLAPDDMVPDVVLDHQPAGDAEEPAVQHIVGRSLAAWFVEDSSSAITPLNDYAGALGP